MKNKKVYIYRYLPTFCTSGGVRFRKLLFDLKRFSRRMFVPYESLELVPASATTDNNYSDNVINVPNNLSESNSKGIR